MKLLTGLAVATIATSAALPAQAHQNESKTWHIHGASTTENKVLSFLQERGLSDRAALATVMGNIKQESLFHANICEGGARVPYSRCYSGGYGLIQWTTTNRYNGLGNFAAKYGGDPSSLNTQLRYMVNEGQWISIENTLKTPGLSINTYMNACYRWLGWGIHGHRTHYANTYYHTMHVG